MHYSLACCHFAALLQTFANHDKFDTHFSLHSKRFQLKFAKYRFGYQAEVSNYNGSLATTSRLKTLTLYKSSKFFTKMYRVIALFLLYSTTITLEDNLTVYEQQLVCVQAKRDAHKSNMTDSDYTENFYFAVSPYVPSYSSLCINCKIP